MLLEPEWISLIPENIRPDRKSIDKIERLRAQFNIPHEAMMMRVVQSRVTTRKVQRNVLDYCRNLCPDYSEKELLKLVLRSRLNISQQTNPYGLTIYSMSDDEIDNVMLNINSFDDLVDYILTLDQQEPPAPDPIGLGKRIDEILEEGVCE